MNTARAIEEAIEVWLRLQGAMTKGDLLRGLGCKGPHKGVDNALRRMTRRRAVRFRGKRWSLATKACPHCKGVGVMRA